MAPAPHWCGKELTLRRVTRPRITCLRLIFVGTWGALSPTMSDTNDSSMYVVVYANEGMDQGYVYLARKLDDDEIMDARVFADQIANMRDSEIDDSPGHVPNCCGDIRVEFLSHPPATERDARNDCDRYLGSTVIWSGESYYFKREGE